LTLLSSLLRIRCTRRRTVGEILASARGGHPEVMMMMMMMVILKIGIALVLMIVMVMLTKFPVKSLLCKFQCVDGLKKMIHHQTLLMH
jgi:hypothetical protein